MSEQSQIDKGLKHLAVKFEVYFCLIFTETVNMILLCYDYRDQKRL